MISLLRRCDKCYAVIRVSSIKDVDKLTEPNEPSHELSKADIINFIKSNLCWKCYRHLHKVNNKEIDNNI